MFSARPRTEFVPASRPDGCFCWDAQWLDSVLECDRLVWIVRRICLAAVGVVGDGARAGFFEVNLAVPVAGSVRLPPGYRWFPLHGRDACPRGCLAGREVVR